MNLPFHSPSILNCKLKITYETLPNCNNLPYIHIRDAYRKNFRVFPMQLLATGTPSPQMNGIDLGINAVIAQGHEDHEDHPDESMSVEQVSHPPTSSHELHSSHVLHSSRSLPPPIKRNSPDRTRLEQQLRQPSSPHAKRMHCCGWF
jgi:hypothetical protein